jgi:methylglutamate dehydrogenase subunit C
LDWTSVWKKNLCIIDSEGKTVREVKVSTEPAAIRSALEGYADRLSRIGVEASSLGLWLYRELRTASHDWAVENSATFVDTGLWKRAQWFAKPSDRDWLDSVTREVTAVRTSVGVCDVSTLGKIDSHGPGIFLDRLYVNMFSTLAVGKARYGVMLREDGFVLDDGTTTRLADDHYFMTTTTANAVKIMQHVDYCRQVLWPELNVQAVSVTEQWAQFAIAGPNSRRLPQKVFPDLELSNDAFPYMSATVVVWMGVPARIFRLASLRSR